MPQLPRLKPWYRLAADEDGVVLRYGASVLEFDGGAAAELLPRLLALLDGSRTTEELVAELGEPIRPAVESALQLLAAQGLLAEPLGPDVGSECARAAELLAATDPYRREASEIASTLAAARVAVLGDGGCARTLAALLEPIVQLVRTDWSDPVAHGCDLTIAAPSSCELALIGEWNRAALEHGTEWLQVLPFDGELAAVGPVFVPWETACHECFALRRSSSISPVRDTAAGAHPSSGATDALVAGYAALVALRRVAVNDGASVGAVVAVEHGMELAATRHIVHRVPRCPACSPGAARAVPSPWSEVHGVAA